MYHFHVLQDKTRAVDGPVRKTKLVSLAWSGRADPDSDYEIIPLPVPYELPPQLYSSQGKVTVCFLLFCSFLSCSGLFFFTYYFWRLTSFCCPSLFCLRHVGDFQSLIYRCSMVLGPDIQAKGCLWSSLAQMIATIKACTNFLLYCISLPSDLNSSVLVWVLWEPKLD